MLQRGRSRLRGICASSLSQGKIIMADKIRVGIVGATVTPGGSGWGANAHVPALQTLPGYELKAVCTAHADTAKASAEKFGAGLAFHDMTETHAHHAAETGPVVVAGPVPHSPVQCPGRLRVTPAGRPLHRTAADPLRWVRQRPDRCRPALY